MEISFPALQSINDGINLQFNSQLWAAPGIYRKFSYDASSTGSEEVYPRLDMLPGIREWVGERVVNWLTQSTFTIKNKTFEGTIGVKREDIEDDKFGLLSPVAAQMGQNAGHLPDLLIQRSSIQGDQFSHTFSRAAASPRNVLLAVPALPIAGSPAGRNSFSQ